MKVVKIASNGKILATAIDNELIVTDRVQAPEGKDLSHWLEFNDEDEARIYYGIPEKKEEEYVG